MRNQIISQSIAQFLKSELYNFFFVMAAMPFGSLLCKAFGFAPFEFTSGRFILGVALVCLVSAPFRYMIKRK